ncbi:leucine-rich repeat-containing protein 59 [Protopterus annectens]|uniref:leucine-rich repeat-containing protein 59 n=1 Tax=Protopterus annectens TaxID=7888 RepID=UPI001CF9AE17|nr:leucine-rich repeat-containing protein 59 [Protopterus annectens]
MSKSSGKALNLREKLDGNELDLSLSNLEEVPVKELAALSKATSLDLSCNSLTSLSPDFCTLTHLVKLDLSKNQLQQLPQDFGHLVNLQHLDLLSNKLVMLPVSFADLKNLKWLDLKDNPLDPYLAKVAGDCLDGKQCQLCATKVLKHMATIQFEQERETQRCLEAEREQERRREAAQKQKEARERELRKRQKAKAKEKRRQEYVASKEAKETQKRKEEQGDSLKENTVPNSRRVPEQKHFRCSLLLKLLLFLIMCAICAVSVVAVCRVTELQHKPLCLTVSTLYEDTLSTVNNHEVVQKILQRISQL